MTTALIIVDVQNDFLPGGSLGVPHGDRIATKISELVSRQGKNYEAVVTTQDWHIDPGEHFSDTPDYQDTWPPHALADTDGSALAPQLDPILPQIDAEFFKGQYDAAYSGFEGKTLDGWHLAEWLRDKGITDVDIVGIATDFCVKATALDAVKEGFKTVVILPLTAYVSDEGFEQAIDEMDHAGVQYGWGNIYSPLGE